MPGKARLRDGSHVPGHAKQSTGGYAEALLLTLVSVAMPDERLEGKTAVPDQRKSSGPRRRRSRASSSQTWRPGKLACTRLARHCPRRRSSQGWDRLPPSRGGTSCSGHRAYARAARRSIAALVQERGPVVRMKAMRWCGSKPVDNAPTLVCKTSRGELPVLS